MGNLLNKHLRKIIGTMSFRYIISIFIFLFASGLSAQTVSLVPEQCGHTIQYGEPIFCTENDSATEYEFKLFTRRDTVVINSTRNYLLVDEYLDDGYQEIAVLESEIFHEAVNNDTVTAVRDTAIGYFHGKLDYTYKDLIYVYKLQLSKQDYSAARGTLKDIYGMTTDMEQDLRDEVTTFCSVNEIYLAFLTAASEAQAVKVLEDNSTTLLSAVDDESPLYSGLAEILYERFADGVFLEYTPLPEMAISNKSMIASEEPDATLFAPYIAIYPNPTDGMVFVEYNFEYSKESGIEFLLEVLGKPHDENCNIGTLNLYSSDSKILHTMQMVQCAGMSVIDLSNYPAGTYIIEVLDCIGNATSVKVVRF